MVIYGITSLVSMMLGAQSVHLLYRPLDDLGVLVEEEKARIKKERSQLQSSTATS